MLTLAKTFLSMALSHANSKQNYDKTEMLILLDVTLALKCH